MRLYFVRHGESVDSSEGLFQRDSSPLSEKGKLQALKIKEELKGHEFDVVLVSPIVRAKETAQIINVEQKIPLMYLEELKEEKRPSQVCGISRNDAKAQRIIQQIEKEYHNITFRFSDEDNFLELKNKAQKLKGKLEQLENKTYLIVGHGMVLKMFTGLLIHGNEMTSHQFKNLAYLLTLDNTGICAFTFENDRWTVNKWNANTI
jgi:uncharacterized phosphatase